MKFQKLYTALLLTVMMTQVAVAALPKQITVIAGTGIPAGTNSFQMQWIRHWVEPVQVAGVPIPGRGGATSAGRGGPITSYSGTITSPLNKPIVVPSKGVGIYLPDYNMRAWFQNGVTNYTLNKSGGKMSLVPAAAEAGAKAVAVSAPTSQLSSEEMLEEGIGF